MLISLDSLSISNTSFILLIGEIEALFNVSTTFEIERNFIFSFKNASTAISLAAFNIVGALFLSSMIHMRVPSMEILLNLVQKSEFLNTT